MASKDPICSKCGSRRSDSNPSAPCPACLMELGLQAWNERAASTRGMAATMNPTGTSGGFTLEQDGATIDLSDLFPQLEILHLVGQGGMGAVYCARQKSLDRLVALKIIKPEKQSREKFADRFVREARALAQLNHPNIITVHDFGEAGDLYYFIMEYVDGINLRQMLQGKNLTPTQALQIVPAVCDALQFAHDKGIVHRDIKPENILIDTEGNIKIADFGLAKLLDTETKGPALTQAFEVMGTMHYMAPEQIEKPLSVDHRADIYSLGVVFYELLTGELPLGRFAPPSQKVGVDIQLDQIVLQTLEKEPALRYQRVSDVKSAVNELPASGTYPPPVVPPNPPPQPTPQYSRRAIPPVAGYEPAYRAPGQPTSAPFIAPTAPVKQKEAGEVEVVTGVHPDRRGPFPDVSFFGAVFHPRTWSNLVYLLLAFPLGLLYFVLSVVGLSLGVSLIIVWVGLLVLLAYFLFARAMMGLERWLAIHWLNVNVPKVVKSGGQAQTVLEQTKNLFFSARTWLGVLYLVGKFPLGVVSFVITVVSVSLPLAMLVKPCLGQKVQIEVFGEFVIVDSFVEGIGLVILGVMLIFPMAYVVNAMAWLHAQWARLMLSSWASWGRDKPNY